MRCPGRRILDLEAGSGLREVGRNLTGGPYRIDKARERSILLPPVQTLGVILLIVVPAIAIFGWVYCPRCPYCGGNGFVTYNGSTEICVAYWSREWKHNR